MITGGAKVAGVVGWPVAHSLSPLIHNAWIEALGLDAAYVPFATENFDSFVEAAKRDGWLTGLNVTLPYKQNAAQVADGYSLEVDWAGAANVLLFSPRGEVHADNTDGAGLLAAFAEQAPDWRPEAGPVLVLGAGGAASGALSALFQAEAAELRVAARRLEAAQETANHWDAKARAKSYSFDQLDAALDGVTAIINATSAGLKGEGTLPPMDAAPPEAVFMDMVYTPLRTPFLQAAAARGHPTVDGLAMLIGQARPSFEMFFGVAPPPPEVVDVRALCLKALGETA